MVVEVLTAEEVDILFHALSDSTRRDIVTRTMLADHSISGLARFYDMSFAAVQKHVALLDSAGLVTKRRRGREQLVRANTATVRSAYLLLEELEKLWRDRVDRMGEVLAEPESTTESGGDDDRQERR